MNASAEKHLAKAQGFLARGEEFYRKAATEVIAALEADPTLTNGEIGERFGRSKDWVRQLVTWGTTDASSRQPTPYSGQADAINLRKTRQLLREAPMEQIEQMIGALPKDRQQKIAAAAGHAYAQARQEYEAEEARLTPAERKAREASKAAVGEFTAKVGSGFTAASIVTLIDQATEKLGELIEGNALTPEIGEEIGKAIRLLVAEYEVAAAMAGLDTDLKGATR